MKVFTDLHHSDLYYSLQLLFEKRLGWQLFRPVGVEWQTEGYWKMAELYNNAPETILQYLDLRDKEDRPYLPPYTGYPLNNILKQNEDYYVMKAEPINHNALTLEQFKKVQPDIVIASMPQHFGSFQKLINDFAPNAKLICHFGNTLWNIADYPYKNIMASIASQPVPDGINAVFYHQEFDMDIFCYQEPVMNKKIYSFVHVFDNYPDKDLFYEVEKLMPDWEFKAFGASCRDGAITGHQNIADKMHEAAFIWHLKAGGDGFGHVIHDAFAIGKPPIVKKSQYADKLAGQLMEDKVTCLDLEGKSLEESVALIKEYTDPDKYNKLCENAFQRFSQVVNFDEEEQQIRKFLENLI